MRQVVLVGAGHAHVEVLRQWALRPPPEARLTLVVDRAAAVYSGMVPGFVAGQYQARELEIDALELARRANGRAIVERATAVDAARRTIRVATGEVIPFDWASLDVGATVWGRELPGVADRSLAARPIDRLIAGTDDLVRRSQAAGDPFRLLVVGAGAGGVELAFCFEARLRRAAARPVAVTLLDRRREPLAGSAPALVRRVVRAMSRRGIEFRGEVEVCAVESEGVWLADGAQLEADAVVWVPGAAAHAFLAETDLPLDAGGFVRIQPSLQVVGFDRLFAVGDCASLAGMRKAGVYAVRSGPVLAENLRRALSGASPLRTFRPQTDFLSLLNLGDGTAVGAKWGVSFEGAWVMRLKDRIDRAFMARYR